MRPAAGIPRAVVIGWTLALVGAGPAAATDLAAVSLQLCARADVLQDDARARTLAQALDFAMRATEANPDQADAHFAVFCALGKQVDDEGVGWRSLGAVRRVRAAVDRALELDPDHLDALLGKTAMLLRLPRLLGGDREEAARCLERARRIGPTHPRAAALWRELHGELPPPDMSPREHRTGPGEAAVTLDHARVDVLTTGERR